MATRTPLRVRPARAEDFAPLAAMLARAFYDDPVTAWFYPDDARRLRHVRRFFGIRLRQLAPQRQIYTTPDHVGAALWTVPGRWREDLRQTVMLLPMLPVLLPHFLRSSRAMREVERRHPVEPHYYLSVLGTEPDRQGGGVGSALLAPVLERCDADGVPAYLESSKESNVGFYARHGFDVTERLQLPNGPPLWLMWREPSRAGRRAGR
ncbi:MAG: GNAT family N-acetyltransferase [Actinomycetota bacterium]|nr:GNAT family N-acetyltransferase [Actinomycetota bacterium]